jgi:hypothetical protein
VRIALVRVVFVCSAFDVLLLLNLGSDLVGDFFLLGGGVEDG